jgi:hypothetical protein
MTKVAQFISAGEDSRSLAGMLPERLQRDAYIFLDSMNREGRIAKRVAEIYGANFHVGYRSATHYLEILPEASKLVGTGHQYHHAHSLGFDKTFKLAGYSAVFGGFLSDTLLKGHHVRKVKGVRSIPFFPQIIDPAYRPDRLGFNEGLLSDEIIFALSDRRAERYIRVSSERPASGKEWFHIYPCSMHNDMPNLYTTRRLFRSYEPFMCKEAVKISAAVPTAWKLNRRLFNCAMKPYLRKSKWLLHADGRLPYFSWWVNIPLQFGVWSYWHVPKRIGLIKGNQGPWGDWGANVQSRQWRELVEQCMHTKVPVNFLSQGLSVETVLTAKKIPVVKRVNLLQIAYPALLCPNSTPSEARNPD